MAIVVADDSCLKTSGITFTAQVRWLGLRVGGRLALFYVDSPDEPSELSQWPRSWWQHYKFIVVAIIIIIITVELVDDRRAAHFDLTAGPRLINLVVQHTCHNLHDVASVVLPPSVW